MAIMKLVEDNSSLTRRDIEEYFEMLMATVKGAHKYFYKYLDRFAFNEYSKLV